MKWESSRHETPSSAPPEPTSSWLERITGIILLLVLGAMAWMVCAALRPDMFRLASVGQEVVVMLSLLGAALLAVSLVALLHSGR